MLKPNSICKNANCRKLFYACAYCAKSQAWRSVACSPECYEEYTNQVIESRLENKPVDLLPDRIDLSKNEVAELMTKPYEEIVAQTKEELSEYVEDIEKFGLGVTIDKINAEINEATDAIVSAKSSVENLEVEQKIPTTRRSKKRAES